MAGAAKGYGAQTPGIGLHRDHRGHCGEFLRAEERAARGGAPWFSSCGASWSNRATVAAGTALGSPNPTCRRVCWRERNATSLDSAGTLGPDRRGNKAWRCGAAPSQGGARFARERGWRRDQSPDATQVAERGWASRVGRIVETPRCSIGGSDGRCRTPNLTWDRTPRRRFRSRADSRSIR